MAHHNEYRCSIAVWRQITGFTQGAPSRGAVCVGGAVVLLAASSVVAGISPGDLLWKVTADDAVAGADYGDAVAIEGAVGIVGAQDHNGQGAVYVIDTSTGQEVLKIVGSDTAAGSSFGASVDICGATAIVSDWSHNEAGEQSGAAYLFDTTTWLELGKLVPVDGAEDYEFGTSAAIFETTAIVGSIGGSPIGDSAGAVYVFDIQSRAQLRKLLPDDGADVDRFGFSVAIHGNIAIVGSPYHDGACPENFDCDSGAAYLFDVTTGQQLHKLTASDEGEGDRFGISVAIEDGIAVVGANRNNDAGMNSGAAYLFDVATGQELDKLTPDSPAPFDFFGSSVSISGRYAAIGAELATTSVNDAGRAYLFDVLTGEQVHEFRRRFNQAPFDSFGTAIAIDQTTVVVGAPGDDDDGEDSGSAYVFDATVCPWDINGDRSVNSADLGLLIGAFGGSDASSDINADGVVNSSDLGLLIGHFGEFCAI